jgi:RNA polymerase sigma factor (sigma-70 family)
MAVDIDLQVEKAKGGDPEALESIVHAIKDDVYGLALRMLWHPEDAEDATQEILIRIVTSLATFRGECRFRTWVWRVAANHLLGARKRRAEREELSFEIFADQLAQGLDLPAPPGEGSPDQALLAEEVKLGCTQGMLLCLDREHRIAYILGEVFDLTGEEAASVLAIAPAAYRQRLSRARRRMRGFMQGHCGIINASRPCRCSRRIGIAIRSGRIDPRNPLFTAHPVRGVPPIAAREGVREMERLHRTAALFRGHPDYAAPERLVTRVRDLLRGGMPTILES